MIMELATIKGGTRFYALGGSCYLSYNMQSNFAKYARQRYFKNMKIWIIIQYICFVFFNFMGHT
jgi:hypothetical protein